MKQLNRLLFVLLLISMFAGCIASAEEEPDAGWQFNEHFGGYTVLAEDADRQTSWFFNITDMSWNGESKHFDELIVETSVENGYEIETSTWGENEDGLALYLIGPNEEDEVDFTLTISLPDSNAEPFVFSDTVQTIFEENLPRPELTRSISADPIFSHDGEAVRIPMLFDKDLDLSGCVDYYEPDDQQVWWIESELFGCDQFDVYDTDEFEEPVRILQMYDKGIFLFRYYAVTFNYRYPIVDIPVAALENGQSEEDVNTHWVMRNHLSHEVVVREGERNWFGDLDDILFDGEWLNTECDVTASGVAEGMEEVAVSFI